MHSYRAIYIPGLGSKAKLVLFFQRMMLSTWSLHGLKAEVFVMPWTNEAHMFEVHHLLLKNRIQQIIDQGDRVVLVGASAGASLAINAFEQIPQVVCMVSICGELRGADYAPKGSLPGNPSYSESLQLMERSIDRLSADQRKNILTLRPLSDRVVEPDGAWLAGAKNLKMPIVGHKLGIGFGVVMCAGIIARFARSSK